MAYNFPNPPVAVGTEYQHYVWDGEKWAITTATGGGPPGLDFSSPVNSQYIPLLEDI